MSGDIDAHVAVLAEDLRGAHRYSEIVEVLRAAGRDDDAEQWARKGLAEHPSGFQTDRLRDQFVDLLLDGGRVAEAVAVRREIMNGGQFIRTTSSSAMPPSRQANGPISAAGHSICSATGHKPSSGTSGS